MNELYLKPGELFFGVPEGRVRTLLGSCVALTLWYPEGRLAGMCHFVLPERPAGGVPDARYGDDAFTLLRLALERRGLEPGDFRAGLYGGGNMFPEFNVVTGRPVGDQNVATARRLARLHGFRIGEEQVGGYAYRQISLDPVDGRVTVNSTEVRKP